MDCPSSLVTQTREPLAAIALGQLNSYEGAANTATLLPVRSLNSATAPLARLVAQMSLPFPASAIETAKANDLLRRLRIHAPLLALSSLTLPPPALATNGLLSKPAMRSRCGNCSLLPCGLESVDRYGHLRQPVAPLVRPLS